MYIFWFSIAFLVVNANANEKASVRLINGAVAKEGAYPYQALILHSGSRSNGALISIQHVVTTARAVESLEEGLVILGAVDLNGERDTWQQFQITKQDVFIHEEFDNETLKFNIALITLPETVNLTASVQPVELPNKLHLGNLFEGQNVVITAYGARDSNRMHKGAKTLNYIQTTIFNPDACEAQFEDSGDQVLCTDRQLDVSVCKGDEGAPVVLEDEKNRKLIGLATLAQSCEDGALADMAVRVSRFTDWITDRLPLGA